MTRRPNERRQGLPALVREAVTIIVAAGSAYLGIRIDLAQLSADMVHVRESVQRHEAQIDRLREFSRENAKNQK